MALERCLLMLLLAGLWAVGARGEADPATWPRPGRNLALGRPYTLAPPPNYALCTCPDNIHQLTDGQYVKGYFWVQHGTVGWQGNVTARIVIDLGQSAPIGGASFHTAAGVAGVEWPQALWLLVSDDQQQWWLAGDLVALATDPPPAQGYATHRYWTDQLATHGRYVAVVAASRGPFLFCDEIEVYEGSEALLAARRRGPSWPTVSTAAIYLGSVGRDLDRQARDLRAAIGQADLTPDQRQPLLAQWEQAAADLMAGQPLAAGARAVLPYNPSQTRLCQVQAALWRAQGRPPLTVWAACPWDPLALDAAPPPTAASPALEVAMLRGEVRSAAFDLANAGPADRALRVVTDGLPGSPRPDWLTVREVAWTGTRAGEPTASALTEAIDGRVTAPAGLTRQVWLSVDSTSLPAGTTAGAVRLLDGETEVARLPLTLSIGRTRLPQRLSLSLGGWDYTDGPGRGITAANLDATVAFLRRYQVDAPWATQAVLPFGRHDADGAMIQPPSTARLDAWLARWPEARYYCVFANLPLPLAPEAAAQRRAAEWLRFWVAHLKTKGVPAAKLLLLIADEPHDAEQAAGIVSWARLIHQVAPEVMVFNDPTFEDPRPVAPEFWQFSTMICPNRPMWLAHRAAFEAVYPALGQAGAKLALYSCSGPARSLDPYSYYRLQAWDCFRVGAVHEGYWAFGDNGDGSSWNEFEARGVCFTPQFLDAAGCTTSKAMEAIREGRYDYEYLTLLRDRLATAERAGRTGPAVERARALLAQAPQRVLGATGVDNIEWAAAKDRTLADQARLDLIAAIEALE
jgi:hypothetical protein